MSSVVDLGLIAGILVGTVPPQNTTILWYDTNDITAGGQIVKYYDVTLEQWVAINSKMLNASDIIGFDDAVEQIVNSMEVISTLDISYADFSNDCATAQLQQNVIYHITDYPFGTSGSATGTIEIWVSSYTASQTTSTCLIKMKTVDWQKTNSLVKGLWKSLIIPAVNDIYWWNGFHYKNISGTTSSTSPDSDTTNWQVLPRTDASYVTHYMTGKFEVISGTPILYWIVDNINQVQSKGSFTSIPWGLSAMTDCIFDQDTTIALVNGNYSTLSKIRIEQSSSLNVSNNIGVAGQQLAITNIKLNSASSLTITTLVGSSTAITIDNVVMNATINSLTIGGGALYQFIEHNGSSISSLAIGSSAQYTKVTTKGATLSSLTNNTGAVFTKVNILHSSITNFTNSGTFSSVVIQNSTVSNINIGTSCSIANVVVDVNSVVNTITLTSSTVNSSLSDCQFLNGSLIGQIAITNTTVNHLHTDNSIISLTTFSQSSSSSFLLKNQAFITNCVFSGCFNFELSSATLSSIVMSTTSVAPSISKLSALSGSLIQNITITDSYLLNIKIGENSQLGFTTASSSSINRSRINGWSIEKHGLIATTAGFTINTIYILDLALEDLVNITNLALAGGTTFDVTADHNVGDFINQIRSVIVESNTHISTWSLFNTKINGGIIACQDPSKSLDLEGWVTGYTYTSVEITETYSNLVFLIDIPSAGFNVVSSSSGGSRGGTIFTIDVLLSSPQASMAGTIVFKNASTNDYYINKVIGVFPRRIYQLWRGQDSSQTTDGIVRLLSAGLATTPTATDQLFLTTSSFDLISNTNIGFNRLSIARNQADDQGSSAAQSFGKFSLEVERKTYT